MSVSVVKKRVLRKKITKITEGFLSTATDAVLFAFFLPIASIGTRPSSAGAYQTFQEANELLQNMNYKTFKQTLYNLKKKGLIKRLKSGLLEIEVTKLGRKRLENLIPCYQTKRPWTKMIYLINYDIEMKNNTKRDLFRNFLSRIGAAKLQQSLYLTPYNPKKLIKEFIKEHGLKGQVLISELSKDSSVGDISLKKLLEKLYSLKELNERYREFVKKYKNVKNVLSKSQTAVDFYSILKNDPQLPFELLPRDFFSDEAYLLFKKFTS